MYLAGHHSTAGLTPRGISGLQSTHTPCTKSAALLFFLHILSLHKPAGEFSLVSNLRSETHLALLGSVVV